jgi:phenylalanyl-tRNA synthetase alpha chain
VLENQITEIQSTALARIQEAKDLDALEAVRVDILGRKGSLAQFSKEFGKLSPEERSAAGKALNAAKVALESALEAKKTLLRTRP